MADGQRYVRRVCLPDNETSAVHSGGKAQCAELVTAVACVAPKAEEPPVMEMPFVTQTLTMEEMTVVRPLITVGMVDVTAVTTRQELLWTVVIEALALCFEPVADTL